MCRVLQTESNFKKHWSNLLSSAESKHVSQAIFDLAYSAEFGLKIKHICHTRAASSR